MDASERAARGVAKLLQRRGKLYLVKPDEGHNFKLLGLFRDESYQDESGGWRIDTRRKTLLFLSSDEKYEIAGGLLIVDRIEYYVRGTVPSANGYSIAYLEKNS